MAAESPSKGKAHAVIVAYPSSGQINPMLDFAKVLHLKGFHITFVNTEFSHSCLFRCSTGTNPLGDADGFRFETISDELSQADRDGPEYHEKLSISTRYNGGAHLGELIRKLNGAGDTPPVTCIIANGFMTFALKVAKEFGIPGLVFCTMSACGFMGDLHLSELIQRGYIPLKDESYLENGYLDTQIDWIPGMKNIRLRDFPDYIRTTDLNKRFFLNNNIKESSNSRESWGLILNTFHILEAEVLHTMKSMFPLIYTVGPMNLLQINRQSSRLSLWKEDFGCMEWLGAQEEDSVVYVNFGSFITVAMEQLMEFAWGLAESNHPFLWVIRPNLVVMAGDGVVELPKEFYQRTKGRSCIASWCPQDKVLSHPAVGGFLTHSGWNSTSESISNGVPMLCWPVFADQMMNCRYVCTEWEIGMEIDQDVKREQVKDMVRELMAGKRGVEMRNNARKWKELAKEATHEDGSSYANIERLLKDLDPQI